MTLLINISFKKEEEKSFKKNQKKKVFKKPTKCLSTSIDKSKMPFIGIKCPDYKLKSRARETVLKLSSLTWWILQEPLEDHPLVSISLLDNAPNPPLSWVRYPKEKSYYTVKFLSSFKK